MDINGNAFTMIAHAFSEGGIWMLAIMAAQIFSIAIIAERVFALYVSRSKNQKAVAQEFEDDIKKGRLDRVVGKARGLAAHEPVAAVIAAGAQAAQDLGGRDEIQAKMDEILAIENAKLERRTGFLSMLGNVGTLLGLLGTIIGLIRAFSSISNMNAAEKSIYLTQGVALAMNATAYGLIMAIPALVMYAVLMNRTQHLQEDLNQAAFRAFNWLSFSYESVPAREGRPQRG
jgi:biopolymer transport protein ExbB/TolQ